MLKEKIRERNGRKKDELNADEIKKDVWKKLERNKFARAQPRHCPP